MRKLFFPEIGNQKNIQRKAKQKPLPAENPLFHYFIPSVTYFHLLHETQCVRVLKTQVRAPPPAPTGHSLGLAARGERCPIWAPLRPQPRRAHPALRIARGTPAPAQGGPRAPPGARRVLRARPARRPKGMPRPLLTLSLLRDGATT